MDGSDGRPDGDPLDGIVPSDYEMDPNVVSGTLANYGIPDALAGLPTLTIVMAPSALETLNKDRESSTEDTESTEKEAPTEYPSVSPSSFP